VQRRRSNNGVVNHNHWENAMSRTTLVATLVAAGLTFGLAGCDVKKTQEGSVTLPKYDVKKEQSGQVTMPKYDVTPPDVKVGSAERTVTVPKLTTQEKKVDVPTVSVTPANRKDDQK
jgi:predicted small lipoprotein YifL